MLAAVALGDQSTKKYAVRLHKKLGAFKTNKKRINYLRLKLSSLSDRKCLYPRKSKLIALQKMTNSLSASEQISEESKVVEINGLIESLVAVKRLQLIGDHVYLHLSSVIQDMRARKALAYLENTYQVILTDDFDNETADPSDDVFSDDDSDDIDPEVDPIDSADEPKNSFQTGIKRPPPDNLERSDTSENNYKSRPIR